MSIFNNNTRYFIALCIGFFIPVSTALTKVFCALMVIFLLVEGYQNQKLKQLFHHPIARVSILFFSFMAFAMLYSSVTFPDSARILSKYIEFFYIPFFLLLFRDDESQVRGLYGFLAAMILTLFLSYFTAITGIELIDGSIAEKAIFKNYITQNLFLAIAAYFFIVQLWTEKNWKWLRGLLILLSIYNILFMGAGRTAYVVLFCLILLLFYQLFKIRGIIVAGLLLSVCSIVLYTASPVLQQRIDVISEDLQRYEQGEKVDYTNSIGSRIQFYSNSVELISKNPLFGSGTGSFAYEYKQLADAKGIGATQNPHNEFLMMTVQWGLIGLGLFLYLLYSLWKLSYGLQKPQQLLAQGVFVTIVVGCLFNSFWLDSTEGHLFAYLIGLCYGKYSYGKYRT